MPKNLKRIREIKLVPDSSGLSFSHILVEYESGASEYADVSISKNLKDDPSGLDLTKAQDVFNYAKGKAEGNL